ncbi:hypothetical protein OUZ56_000008 [Daphnia magna]|uniref:Uncharacterized protein n=1 Tax=Daphnia magna TaxID=35525 RepID=A0ABQ9ZYG0_9CRUS|nr:hypothetical protein OUZ56_000008 [Daphnia magna]
MDYLLRLIHHHRPVIDYNVLPLTGKQLLQIDGRDYAGFISKTPVVLPTPTAFPSTVGSNQNDRSPIDAGPSVAAPLRSSSNAARVTSVTRGVRQKNKPTSYQNQSFNEREQRKPSTRTNLHQEKGKPSEFSLDPIESRRTNFSVWGLFRFSPLKVNAYK